MKTKVQKKEELKALQSKLPDSQITVFTSFARSGEKGLSVSQMTQLKRVLREAHSEYVVTKKTLVERAAKEMGQAEIDVYGMAGSLGLVVGKDEPYSVAKKVYDFAKKNPALQFFGAVVNGAFISKEEFMEMAKMPSKEVLIGRLLGMMKYPVTAMYIVISEIAKKASAGQAPVAETAPVAEEAAPVAEAPAEEAPATEVPAEPSAETPAAEVTN